MSKALVEAPSLRPEVRLQQAVQQFKLALDDEEQRSFKTYNAGKAPAPNDVYRLTAQISRSNKIDQRFGPRLTTLLQTVQQYAIVVDVAIQAGGNPIAIAVWAVLRFTLLTAVNVKKFFDRLTELMMKIGQYSPRFQNLAVLYPQSRELRIQLHEYLIVVVTICKETVLFMKANALSQTLQTFKSKFEAFESQIHSIAEAIRLEVSVASKQMQVYEAKESSKFRNTLSKDLEERKQRRQKHNWLKFLDKLSSYDFESSYRFYRKRGCSTWITSQTAYQAWISSSASSTLLCTGILGSGKSVAAANLVEELRQSSSENIVSCFFSRFDVDVSLTSEEIIGAITHQILSCMPMQSEVAEKYASYKTVRDIDVMLELMRNTSSKRPVFIILDDLDQCPDDESKVVIQWLHQLLTNTTQTYRIFISARPEVLTTRRLAPHYEMNVSMTNEDFRKEIGEYILIQLKRHVEEDDLFLGDPNLILKIHDALLEKAESMYLWVDFQIKSLCAQKRDRDILKMLDNLPKDIWTTFDRILEALNDRTESEVQLARFLFSTVAVAKQPLTTSALRVAYNITPGEPTWNEETLVNDTDTMLKCCGSLLIQDEENQTVSYAHHSVKQYLVGESIREPLCFKVDEQLASLHLGKVCLTYLNLPKSEKQLVKTTTPPAVRRNVDPLETIVGSTLERHKWSKKIALGLLSSKSKQGTFASLAPMLSPMSDSADTDIVGFDQEATFLPYATHFWLQHTEHIYESSGIYQRWFKDALERYHSLYDITWPPVVQPMLELPTQIKSLFEKILKYRHISLFLVTLQAIGLQVHDSKLWQDVWYKAGTLFQRLKSLDSVLLNSRSYTWDSAPTFTFHVFQASLRDYDADTAKTILYRGTASLRDSTKEMHATSVLMDLSHGDMLDKSSADVVSSRLRPQPQLGFSVGVTTFPLNLRPMINTQSFMRPLASLIANTIVPNLIKEGIYQGWHSPETLAKAIELGQYQIARVLMKPETDGTKALLALCSSEKIDESGLHMAEQLIDLGASLKSRDGCESPLVSICKSKITLDNSGRCALIELLLLKGADIEEKLEYGIVQLSPLLLTSSRKGRLSILKVLLERGANIAPSDAHPDALYYACASGQKDYVNELLKYGAKVRISPKFLEDPRLYDKAMMTVAGTWKHYIRDLDALTVAAKFDHFDIVELLVRKRAVESSELILLLKRDPKAPIPRRVKLAIKEYESEKET